MPERTHRMAVTAYIVHDGKFLLLKRTNPPMIWGPPGGRLNPDENPNEGVLREVFEECGLTVKILHPVDIWYGDFGRGIYVSVDYLAISPSSEVSLSDEHSDYIWSDMNALRNGQPSLGSAAPAFTIHDFRRAWELYQKLL
ncbi:MAG TPA: NUDIX domain-containing protein [bacterium]|nr:NUDIX domain-containing protein [bacterium]HNF85502.1 NUDIX domain-containing protein [bacterium]HNH31364.1 NUDIX domain-containing protein [bacterium]HNJ71770.1 NUDIX domain-containing protein [bacterium]HNL26575.1 NUDIX domain-containing protein [bacterium]